MGRLPRRPSFTDNSLRWIERLKQLLLGKSTWLGLLYMVLMLPKGVVYFTVTVALLSLAVAFIAMPVATIIFNLPVAMIGDAVYYLPDWLTPLVALGGILFACRRPPYGQVSDPPSACNTLPSQILRDGTQLLRRRFQILNDISSDEVGIRKIHGFLQRLIAHPEDVDVDSVACQDLVIREAAPTTVRVLLRPGCRPFEAILGDCSA